jgi:hypothetical protein
MVNARFFKAEHQQSKKGSDWTPNDISLLSEFTVKRKVRYVTWGWPGSLPFSPTELIFCLSCGLTAEAPYLKLHSIAWRFGHKDLIKIKLFKIICEKSKASLFDKPFCIANTAILTLHFTFQINCKKIFPPRQM